MAMSNYSTPEDVCIPWRLDWTFAFSFTCNNENDCSLLLSILTANQTLYGNQHQQTAHTLSRHLSAPSCDPLQCLLCHRVAVSFVGASPFRLQGQRRSVYRARAAAVADTCIYRSSCMVSVGLVFHRILHPPWSHARSTSHQFTNACQYFV